MKNQLKGEIVWFCFIDPREKDLRRCIAYIYGFDGVMTEEFVEFEESTMGIALNLESNNIGVVLMGDDLMI